MAGRQPTFRVARDGLVLSLVAPTSPAEFSYSIGEKTASIERGRALPQQVLGIRLCKYIGCGDKTWKNSNDMLFAR